MLHAPGGCTIAAVPSLPVISTLYACAAALVCTAAAAVPDLALPTTNRALLTGKPADFFMGVDRQQPDGTVGLVWQGGQFGFVRQPLEWEGKTLFTRFHEGVDISPVQHSPEGRPTDTVCAISAATVASCQTDPAASELGNYVVLEHDWGCGPVFSRYAHLASISVAPGQTLAKGAPLGILGSTGSSIEPRRAHLHLEIALMMNGNFDKWQAKTRPVPQAVSRFDSLNLCSLDPAALFLALEKEPALPLPRFLSRQAPGFTLLTSHGPESDLLTRYPWLWQGTGPPGDAPSWEITCTAWGLPISVKPGSRPVTGPVVSWVEPFAGKHSWRTMGRLLGSGPTATISPSGLLWACLLSGTSAPPPPAPGH